MNEKKLGQEPAFPLTAEMTDRMPPLYFYPIGMSKRFYAACAAMQGLLANPDVRREVSMSLIILEAYELADELLKQENQQ